MHAGPSRAPELAAQARDLRAATGHEPIVVETDGYAAARIAELARALPAALVITGSRGLQGVRVLSGVSGRAATIAPCSVLVVRDGSRAARGQYV